MNILDITHSIRPGMVSYPGEPSPTIEALKSQDKGNRSNVSLITMTTHAGTHLDAPSHFVPGGATVDQTPPSTLLGTVDVIEINGQGHIGVNELESARIPRSSRRLLFKTRNGSLWQHQDFQKDYVAISVEAARWLVKLDFLLVGLDYLSVEPYGSAQPDTHRTLLGAGIAVVEGLDLSEVAPGRYTLICAPLRIEWGDGSPVRAWLIDPVIPELDFQPQNHE